MHNWEKKIDIAELANFLSHKIYMESLFEQNNVKANFHSKHSAKITNIYRMIKKMLPANVHWLKIKLYIVYNDIDDRT